MAMTVDTLIQNLETQASSFSNSAFARAKSAGEVAAGSMMWVPETDGWYLDENGVPKKANDGPPMPVPAPPPKAPDTDDIDPVLFPPGFAPPPLLKRKKPESPPVLGMWTHPDWDAKHAQLFVAKMMATLNYFFRTYFPDLDDNVYQRWMISRGLATAPVGGGPTATTSTYEQWLTQLQQGIASGPPAWQDNSQANLFRQHLDAVQGARNKREIRSAFANRGHELPPGVLIGATMDDIDARTVALTAGAVDAANAATSQLAQSYQQLLSTAISTRQSRVEAINAMSELMRATTAMYNGSIETRSAYISAHIAAAEKLITFQRGKLELDSINDQSHAKYSGMHADALLKNGSTFAKSEGMQVQSAIAAANQAARIAAAAYSALNTVVSASTVGFS